MFFSLPLWQNPMENLYAPFEGVSNIFFIFIFFIGGVSYLIHQGFMAHVHMI